MPHVEEARLSLVQSFVERLRFTLIALVVSTFPESAKRNGWPAVYASVAAHAFSGWVEVLVSVGVFGLGFLRHVDSFVRGSGWTYLSHQPTLTYGDFFGIGALGYVSYLLTPIAWLSLYCIVEGILRALDAAFSDCMLGMALVVLPWRTVIAVQRHQTRRRTEELLGPERPDEIVMGEPGAAVALTIFAAREKLWSEHQVLEYRDEFYTVVRKRLEPRGQAHMYRYDLQHFEHGEVIRGVLLRYGPEQAEPAVSEPSPQQN